MDYRCTFLVKSPIKFGYKSNNTINVHKHNFSTVWFVIQTISNTFVFLNCGKRRKYSVKKKTRIFPKFLNILLNWATEASMDKNKVQFERCKIK